MLDSFHYDLGHEADALPLGLLRVCYASPGHEFSRRYAFDQAAGFPVSRLSGKCGEGNRYPARSLLGRRALSAHGGPLKHRAGLQDLWSATRIWCDRWAALRVLQGEPGCRRPQHPGWRPRNNPDQPTCGRGPSLGWRASLGTSGPAHWKGRYRRSRCRGDTGCAPICHRGRQSGSCDRASRAGHPLWRSRTKLRDFCGASILRCGAKPS